MVVVLRAQPITVCPSWIKDSVIALPKPRLTPVIKIILDIILKLKYYDNLTQAT